MTETSKDIARTVEEDLLEKYLTLDENQRDQDFPTTKSAAKLAGVSRRTIQFWVETGAVEAIFVGRKCRVNFDSLKKYLKSRVEGAEP
jgi:excisionase family DNA binding protein